MKAKNFLNEELENLISYVMWSARNHTLYGSVRIAKIITILRYEFNLRYKIIWASLGPYPYNQNKTLKFMQQRNLINISKPDKEVNYYTFQLTDKGRKFIRGKLKTPVEGLPTTAEIGELIKKDLYSLIEEATELFASNVGSKDSIGEYSVTHIFDWNNLGRGIWQPYHDTLMWCYLDLRKKNFSFVKAMSKHFPKYENIHEQINTKELNLNGRTFREVLSKLEPKTLNENKIEGKNYIDNKWVILEAINMIHALSGVMPSIKDLAWMCFSTFKLEIEKDPENNEFIKKFINKSHLRYAIYELQKAKIIKSFKDGKEYRYKVAAKQFVDDFEEKTFKLIDKKTIDRMFEEFKSDGFIEGAVS